MVSESKLVKRAQQRNNRAVDLMRVHNDIVKGMEARIKEDYYFGPDYRQSAFDIARQGLFLARKLSIGSVRLAQFCISVGRFNRTYGQLHPDHNLSNEQLAACSWELAPIDDDTLDQRLPMRDEDQAIYKQQV